MTEILVLTGSPRGAPSFANRVTARVLKLLAFLGMADVKVIQIERDFIESALAKRAVETGLEPQREEVDEPTPHGEAALAPEPDDEGGLHALVSF